MAGELIGRDPELSELLAGLEDAKAGRGRAFLVVGDAGIGKTTLAEALATQAGRRDARVVWGRAWQGGGAPPFWPWAQILEALVADLDETALRAHLARGAGCLAVLAPGLAERLGAGDSPPAPPDSDAGRFYLFEATTRFLRDFAAARPLVLVLEDVLLADRPSRLLLRFLAREARAARLLIVATARTAETADAPEASELVEELVREGYLLRLGGLDRKQTGRLVTAISGRPPWPAKLAAIHAATEGNPLFVREVTRLLAAAEALDQPGPLSIPIPESVRVVIGRRLAPLSADAVAALSAAAIVGRDFDLPLVCAACELPEERVLASLSEAVAGGLVVEPPGTAGVYRFAHALMREVLYEKLPLAVRAQMHRQVGEALERLHGPDSPEHLAELALHFVRAGGAGRERSAAYARRAADRAMQAFAYEEAAKLYRAALDAREPAHPEPALCDLLLRLADAQARAGDYVQSKATYLRAAEFARTLGEAAAFARAALGYGEPQVEAGLVDRRLIGLLQDALEGLGPGDDPLRVLLLSRLSIELTFSPQEALRESLSDQAVAMARRLEDRTVLPTALRARWLVRWGPEGLEERIAIAAEMLRLARAMGNRELELVALVRKATCAVEASDTVTARETIADHARLAAELRMPYHEWVVATMRGGQALLEGALPRAEAHAEASRTLLPGRLSSMYAHLNQVTLIRWEQGRLTELRETWHGVSEKFPQAGFARGWVVLADAEQGLLEDSGRELRALVDELPRLPRGGLWLATLAVAALGAARLGDREAAARIFPLLEPHVAATIVIPMPQPAISFGSAALYAAQMAAMLGHADTHALFEKALAINERLGAIAFLARSRCEYAAALLRSQDAAERQRAADLLERAGAAADELGLVALRARVEQVRALGEAEAEPGAEAPTPVEIAAEPAANVFRREGEYWTIAYERAIVRLPDSKGLRCLSLLLASPGREQLAVELEASAGKQPRRAMVGALRGDGEAASVQHDLGDAGELLDARAKAAYRERLEELREELEEAESFADSARATRAREEIDFLARELARAVGLGGRGRRAASHSERARLNVTRAIRAAMRSLQTEHPSLGEHLSLTVRTGRYCSYQPDPRAPIHWAT